MTSTTFAKKNDETQRVRRGETQTQRLLGGGDPLLGTSLGGRYLVVRLIGRGGMARVYEGQDEVHGGPVAIKVIDGCRPGDHEGEDLATRFRREARIACTVSSPNAVATYAHGESADGLQWLIMELCPGRPLSAVLEAEGRLAPARAVRLMAQVLDALEAAHAIGVVHRDVKLSNVMIDETDFARVLDFGLAKRGGGVDGLSVTAVGATVGSPHVMSPEQCMGDACDARSDVYSAGVVLYQLLAGRLPFDATDTHRLLWQHVTVPPPPLRPACDVPEALERAVLRALAKDPDDRWPSARAFRRAIEAALDPPRALAPGDRFRVRSRSGNRYAGRVTSIAEGRLGVELDDGRSVGLALARLDLTSLELE